ncbi:MAG: NAD-dependent epimerase/dehydratase family protein [Kiritimatiellia bacterium]|nr:NAD-dependent epimerase/dehydratase family protein [Kiritimatiellia bacterium]
MNIRTISCRAATRNGLAVIPRLMKGVSCQPSLTPACLIPPGTKVLVTGATGFTGSVLVRKLVKAGLEVHAIARATSDLQQFGDLKINWHRGQVYDEAVVTEAAKDVQYVFHLAAAYREAKYGDEIYRRVHVLSTQFLANAVLQNNDFRRFIHVSTVGVHGHIADPPADENYPLNPDDIYQRTKAEAELWLRQFAPEHKIPFTVIRPAAIYGPGDTRLLKFFRMASYRWLILPGTKRGLYHLVHVDDLTNVMMLAAIHPAALNEIFICGNSECMTLEQIAAVVARKLGTHFTVVRLPAAPFFFIADVCEGICRKFGIEPPIHRRRLAFFTKDRSFNTGKLRAKLGYTMQYTNEEGLLETTRWYCAHGLLRSRRESSPSA